MILNRGQYYGLKEYEKGNNLFITGSAGTGKTVLANAIMERAKSQGKRVVFTASTGVAAQAFDGGVTIHSLLRWFDGWRSKSIDFIDRSRILKDIDLLIIDEISMIGRSVFDYIGICFNAAQTNTQLIVIGDFFQLPPVGESEYAFESFFWELFNFHTIHLSQVMRQENEVFIKELNRCRVGDSRCIDYLNTNAQNVANHEVTCLCARKYRAANINNDRIGRLDGEIRSYDWIVGAGEPNARNYTCQDRLALKVGAHIMMLKNTGQVYNGMTAVVTGLGQDEITVELENGTEHIVERELFEFIPDGNMDHRQAVWQFPLIPAYALTIHKAQGKTISRITLYGAESWEHGQIYTGLSRVPSINGLYLAEELTPEMIHVDGKVLEFYHREEIELSA